MSGWSFPSPKMLLVPDAIVGRHVRAWLLIVFVVAAVGTAGYATLLGWPFGDALYMTVITLTTVGFHEVRPLDDLGRAWTMLVSMAGVGIIFGSVGIVAEAFVAEAASGRREARRMAEAVDGLRNHYIVCGYGRVGSTVARELVDTGQRLVVIDVLAASVDRARLDGHLVVVGDATDDETLRNAGVERARGLVTTIDSDANNVYVTLSARAINPKLFIVGRANTVGSESKLLQAGANRVVSHDGRPADRGAGNPAPSDRLHRPRAVAREPELLARGGGDRRGESARRAAGGRPP
jgi:voltage-gated potassium channel